jgi:hypothetical protein
MCEAWLAGREWPTAKPVDTGFSMRRGGNWFIRPLLRQRRDGQAFRAGKKRALWAPEREYEAAIDPSTRSSAMLRPSMSHSLLRRRIYVG